MTHHDAVALIDNPWFRNHATPMRWADLGCGSGTFTLALADLLAPGSSIEAIDLRPSIAAQTTKSGVTIHPRAADFTTLDIRLVAFPPGRSRPSDLGARPASAPASALAAPLPDRIWPGTEPLVYHGIIMANSLHYVSDQKAFITRLHTPVSPTRSASPSPGAILLVEYDTDVPVARWVPYPLSFTKATELLRSTGWPRVQKLGTQPSAFGRTELYAALALPEE